MDDEEYLINEENEEDFDAGPLVIAVQSNLDQELAIESSTPGSEESIRTEALMGLRGLASLHVLVYHCLYYSKWRANISGTLEVPMFFLLSGYSLAIKYGRTEYDGHTSCCCNKPNGDLEPTLFKSFSFYRNRFARVMPMYYIANFVVAAPLIAVGGGWVTLEWDHATTWITMRAVATGLPVGMFVPACIYFWPFIRCVWMISTLWFFYLIFPLILHKFQKYSSERASKWITWMFWIQLVGGVGLATIFALIPIPYFPGVWEWVSTGWGVSRLPVFLMGVHAGILRLRHQNNHAVGNRNNLLNFISAWFPCVSNCCRGENVATQERWATLVTYVSISHVVLILIFALLDSLLSPGTYILAQAYTGIAIQFVAVHSLLMVIDGLTRDGGLSKLARICKSKVFQQLGRMSFTLYVIQEPLIFWLAVAVKKDETKQQHDEVKGIPMPVWGIPIIIIVCPLIAWVLTKFVEEPMRKLLRSR